MSGYKFPAVYDYPPFWTLQSNAEQRKLQIDLWCNLICSYVLYTKKAMLNVGDALELDLFNNAKIGRSLPKMALVTIIDALCERRLGRWESGKSHALVYGKSLEEWGEIGWNWAEKTGQLGTVFTIAELVRPELASGGDAPFDGADLVVIIEALRCLAGKGKASMIKDDYPLDQKGVKFLKSG
jgi:ESCRT-II complex subunit VPS25